MPKLVPKLGSMKRNRAAHREMPAPPSYFDQTKRLRWVAHQPCLRQLRHELIDQAL